MHSIYISVQLPKSPMLDVVDWASYSSSMERQGSFPLFLNWGEPGIGFTRDPLWRWCCANFGPGCEVDQPFSPWSLRALSHPWAVWLPCYRTVWRGPMTPWRERERSSARTSFQLSPSRCQADGEVSGTLQVSLDSNQIPPQLNPFDPM